MPVPALPDLAALHQTRELLLSRGLAVLTAWALGSIVGGGYGLARAPRRSAAFYFQAMTVGWGLVNAALAFGGIYALQPVAPAGLRLADLFGAQLRNENLFALNAGLDAAYVMTGFYLRARAEAPDAAHPARLRGYGRALWVQGGFLLVFDAAMWALLHGQGRAWLALAGAR